MSNNTYLSCCADYCPLSWTPNFYQNQLNTISSIPQDHYLAMDQDGFIHLSIIRKIIEVVKGFLGFGDATDSTVMTAKALKLLYFAEANGCIQKAHLVALRALRNNSASPLSDPAVTHLVNEILLRHEAKTPQTKYDILVKMRIVSDGYHKKHSQALLPHFWFRWNHKPELPCDKLVEFGDASLELSEQAFYKGDGNLEFHHLLQAYALQNHSSTFQNKLWQKLKFLLDTHNISSQAKARDPKIQEMILSMALLAIQNGI